MSGIDDSRADRTPPGPAAGPALPRARALVLALALGLACMACGQRGPAAGPAAQEAPATPQPAASAAALVARLNRDLRELDIERNAADWVQATYITGDTQLLKAKANERFLAYFSEAVQEAKAFEGKAGDEASARALKLLELTVSAPAPDDPGKRREFTQILARMQATYGEGKYCPPSAAVKEPSAARKEPAACRNIDELSETLASSRDYDALTEAWAGWHTISRPMRADYQRYVELANEGARSLGYADLGAMWRSAYDMPAEQFAAEVERLWGQLQPLYEDLHCYTRARLAKKYGEARVPAGKPIPAQLLGNMWAQQWRKIYGDLLEPYPGVASLDVDRALKSQRYDAVRMTRAAESFYTSLGFPPLPKTFWERSMLTRPRDREVVCHASAWQMDGGEDVRIKQCILPTEEDLSVIYHELGHVYYDLSYKDQPYLFQSGAHQGFHEAIGDTVLLSMTPAYLQRIGLVGAQKSSREAVINQQMNMAADTIAFLPFGKLIDQWRWRVFSGEVKPEDYNAAWWELRRQYQGVAPPVPRSEADFDPGAKYHVPGNVSYTRYFLAYVMQFQFHRALCAAAGFEGPLHECSVYGNEEAGRRFQAMLAAGASRPWPETLEKLTGTRQMDASAILDYFAPLSGWLKEQNAGQKCGW